MNQKLSLNLLLPTIQKRELLLNKLKNTTFVGIDFGTSTTVASYAVIGSSKDSPIISQNIPIPQKLIDGRIHLSHLVPTCVAWHNEELFIGQGASTLKGRLLKGKNIWHSFKMELGTDLGPQYYNSVLHRKHRYGPVERPVEVAAIFFRYLSAHISKFIEENSLPENIKYSVSIPASFEANQRKDLLEALNAANLPLTDQVFIDEPNAAFLNYLVEANKNVLGGYQVPEDSPLNIMVFDFGAGTCDISIIEITRVNKSFVSKNLAISRFEALGGDDIDKAIAQLLLLPQLFDQNNLLSDDLRKVDIKKRIIPKLHGVAERLKILICKSVSAQKIGKELPNIAASEERRFINDRIEISLPKQNLILIEPSIRFREFMKLIEKFLDEKEEYNYVDEDDTILSIFTPIISALEKAEISAEEIDLVLLVGGSSENPYVQNALINYFKDTEVEVPTDLRSHVSAGAAIHCFINNGFGINIVQPITSEPIFLLAREGRTRVIFSAGTEIPSKEFIIEDLYVENNHQKVIEMPICVTSSDKILNIVKIESPDSSGFERGSKVRIIGKINNDKLIEIRAEVSGIKKEVNIGNPFANRKLTYEERVIHEAKKQVNESAAKNHGKPTKDSLLQLVEAYEKAKDYLNAAETMELISQIDINGQYETNICAYYDWAGYTNKAESWANHAYKRNRNSVNAFNWGLFAKEAGDERKYSILMEEALSMDRDAYYVLLNYGIYLDEKGDSKGREKIQRAFEIMYNYFTNNSLPLEAYRKLKYAAEKLNNYEVVEKINDHFQKEKINIESRPYNKANLVGVMDNTPKRLEVF